MVAAVARQKPEWPPGTRGVYHTVSIVFVLGKLIQCVSGEYPWDFFRREVTERLGVDYHLRCTEAERVRYCQNYDTEWFVQDAKIPPDVMARFFAGKGDYSQVLDPRGADERCRTNSPAEMRAGPRGSSPSRRWMESSMAFGALRPHDRSDDRGAVVREVRRLGTPMRTALGILVNDPEFFYIGPNPKRLAPRARVAALRWPIATTGSRLAIRSTVIGRHWP